MVRCPLLVQRSAVQCIGTSNAPQQQSKQAMDFFAASAMTASLQPFTSQAGQIGFHCPFLFRHPRRIDTEQDEFFPTPLRLIGRCLAQLFLFLFLSSLSPSTFPRPRQCTVLVQRVYGACRRTKKKKEAPSSTPSPPAPSPLPPYPQTPPPRLE